MKKTVEQNRSSLNEELKKRELSERYAAGEDEPLRLDDAQRVKVLSPVRLVVKRFFRNKLAMVGLALLIFMFVFCFVGALIYPYGQTQKFSTYRLVTKVYAVANRRTEFSAYKIAGGISVPGSVKTKIDTIKNEMVANGLTETDYTASDTNEVFTMLRLDDNAYLLKAKKVVAGSYNTIAKKLEMSAGDAGDGLTASIAGKAAGLTVNGETVVFTADGMKYELQRNTKIEYTLYRLYDGVTDNSDYAMIATTYVFDMYDTSDTVTGDFINEAILALNGSGSFTYDGKDYTITVRDGVPIISTPERDFAEMSTLSVRLKDGKDLLTVDFKHKVAQVIESMEAATDKEERLSSEFVYAVPQINPDTGLFEVDAEGNDILHEETISITKTLFEYQMKYDMVSDVYAAYVPPSSEHLLGTDDSGYDVLSRIMYGGRVSLLVGFVVVIIETILGVIMGGIAGYFGGWIDTLIMRLVDIFYCIPTMPILIILGSLFDALRLEPYVRLAWMMAVLGFLGWAGIARLVRGQILSLREQEFMVAAEATGVATGRKIFKHLIPNVMPQLIVSMTMGLGSVILTESTLSFLGLGVKHPLATWGNIINSVSTINALESYTYIWIPVGVLICLTVIAFNFVGDGLRDAFDPKMKR